MEDVYEKIIYLPEQERVLGWTSHDDEILAVLADGGVRGGKSFVACKAAQIVAASFPGSETLICRNTRVNLKETTQKTFFDLDANGEAVTSRDLWNPRGWNETRGILTWNNQSKTCFWGLDTTENIDRVKSTQWSFIILEEANGISFDILQFLLYTRLSHPVGPGKMLLTTNTDKGEDALYRLFYRQHTCSPNRKCETCAGPCLFRRQRFTTDANRRNLPEKYMETIDSLARVNPGYSKVYAQGEYAVVEGLIYPMYDERYHIIDFPAGYEWDESVDTKQGYDHGFGGSPSCRLEVKVLPDGTLVFWDEYYVLGKTISQISQDFISAGISTIHSADPSIGNTNQDDHGRLTSVQQLFLEHGVTMHLANNDVDGRIERARDLMNRDPEHLNPIPGVVQEGMPNAPRFFIARQGGRIKCPMLHSQIMKRESKKNAHGERSTKKWNPKDGDDHALDPAEYLVAANYHGRLDNEKEPERFTAGWARKKAIEKFATKQQKMRAISQAI